MTCVVTAQDMVLCIITIHKAVSNYQHWHRQVPHGGHGPHTFITSPKELDFAKQIN